MKQSATNPIDRLNGRLALILVSGAVLFLVLMGWFALVAPKRSKAADLDAKTASAEIQLSDTQRFLRSSAGRTSALELKRLTRAVPSDPQMSEILRQLSRASRAAGVKIDGITPAPTVSTAAGGQAVPLTVAVEGHYFRLQRFLHLLRSAAVVGQDSLHVSGRLLAVDGIDFESGGTSSGGGGKNGLITATIAVNAFVSTPGQGAATGQTSTAQTTSTASP